MSGEKAIIDNTTKRSYIWNTLAGMLNSFQLLILLLIIPRTNGQVAAGIVSGAFAIGNLVMAIGKYGMRSFQVSDVANKYSDRTYFASRIITNLVMLAVFVVYGLILFKQDTYTVEKLIILFLVCLLKWLDAYEDVFHGMLQRAERFDVASKAMAIRLICTITVQIMCLLITKDLIISFVVSLVVSIFLFLVLTIKPSNEYWMHKRTDWKSVGSVLKECLPLGLWMFVNMYLGNFPKYAIDVYLSDEIQATFNYIFMPVFTINLLNTFIFQPLITKVSKYWQEENLKEFKKVICMQLFLIIGITILAVFLGSIWGIPLLEYVFSCKLSLYKVEFLLLLVSGGLLALTSLFATLLTIMRKQNWILILYGVGAIIAFVLQRIIILNYDIMGITLLYMILLILLTMALGGAVLLNMRKSILKEEEQ